MRGDPLWRGYPRVQASPRRAVAAALVGIGTQSYRDRNAGVEVYRTMLSLKVLWSATACIGLAWTALSARIVQTRRVENEKDRSKAPVRYNKSARGARSTWLQR